MLPVPLLFSPPIPLSLLLTVISNSFPSIAIVTYIHMFAKTHKYSLINPFNVAYMNVISRLTT